MAMYKVVLEKIYMILTLLQWDFFFEAAHGLGEKRSPP